MTSVRVEHAIQTGVAYIESAQQPDGGFASFSSPSRSPFLPRKIYQTTFMPALLLSALNAISTSRAKKIRKSTADWLLEQKSPHWSFNYWAIAAPERKTLPLPDDLDDTFCSLLALKQYDPLLIDASALAHIVKLLIANESEVGGPYKTWLTTNPDSVWQDVDLAVNANIGGFLRLVASPLPNLTKVIETAITDKKFTSPYYPSPYPILYFISRFYTGAKQEELTQYLLKLRNDNGHWGTPLQTALATTSLVRLGESKHSPKAISYLLTQQQPDGSWPAEAFCLDPAIRRRSYYNGAAALTTAFALEALYIAQHAKPTPIVNPQTGNPPQYDKTLDLIEAETNNLDKTLQLGLRPILQHTLATDNQNEIVLLPYLFNDSLIEPLPEDTTQCFVHLSAANVYGWTAYEVYDDFLDGEGHPAQLPAANTALRASLRHFKQALPKNAAFHAYVDQLFDRIDAANTWEIQHCRMPITSKRIKLGTLPIFPDTLVLAERSVGHTLGPLGVLAALHINPDDPKAAATELALRHYIVARQLNDDLHDWEQDIRAGIITYVVTQILEGLAVKPGTHQFATLLPAMQRRFWHYTVPSVCHLIHEHTTAARQTARSSKLFKSTNLITHLTKKIDSAIQTTLEEQRKAKDFLAAYQEV